LKISMNRKLFFDRIRQSLFSGRVRVTMRALASVAFIAFPAAAHGPWPYECCHERDCAEVDSKSVKEIGDTVHISIQPGSHPMWPADGRTAFVGSIRRAELRKPVTGEWGVCISPTGKLLCVFPPMTGV
jgi:hypothetical protein